MVHGYKNKRFKLGIGTEVNVMTKSILDRLGVKIELTPIIITTLGTLSCKKSKIEL